MSITEQIRTQHQELIKEREAMRDEFNRAIDFAINQGIEAAMFLRCWREGDVSEWPEFTTFQTGAAA